MTWSLTMTGHGHEAGEDRKARELARKFLEDLRAVGHQVGVAQFADVDGDHNLLEQVAATPKEG